MLQVELRYYQIGIIYTRSFVSEDIKDGRGTVFVDNIVSYTLIPSDQLHELCCSQATDDLLRYLIWTVSIVIFFSANLYLILHIIMLLLMPYRIFIWYWA
jgi:hypothetical protein